MLHASVKVKKQSAWGGAARHGPCGASSSRLLLLLLRLALTLALASSASNSDAERLLAFKGSLDNGDALLASWVAGTDPCSSGWTGVSCDPQRRVTRLVLRSFGLQGTIPSPSGWILPERLKQLDLWNNRGIHGPIPPAWRLPEGLQDLFMMKTTMKGNLDPEWMANLPSTLKTLYVRQCNLTGTLPSDFQLPLLERFDASINELTGTVPQWRLPQLQLLQINHNRLHGSIPSSFTFNALFANCLLMLQGNDLSGSLPTWPDRPVIQVAILPGNPGLCGEVPRSPLYFENDIVTDFQAPVTQDALPACSGPNGGQPSSDSGGASAAVIAGAVAGAVGGTALLVLLGLAYWKARRRAGSGRQAEDGQAGPKTTERPSQRQSPHDNGFPEVLLSPEQPNNDVATGSKLTNSALTASNGRLAESGSVLASSSSRSGETTTSAHDSMKHKSLGVNVQAYIIPWSHLTVKREIGRGASGRVYLCYWRDTMVAAKLLLGPDVGDGPDYLAAAAAGEQTLSVSSAVLANLKTEANLLAALRHPNVTAFMGLCLQPPSLVMEYCVHGSLYDVLKQARESLAPAEELTWPLRLKIALGAAQGMMYLHSLTPSPILHRDLKSPNLLLDATYNAKVSDFNLSRILGESSLPVQNSTAVGNPRWLAPEVLEGGSHSLPSDVFSYGIILWELMTLSAPWEGATNLWQVSAAVIQGQRPAVPEPGQLVGGAFEGLGAYTRLMQDCWAQDPAARPGFQEVVRRIRDEIMSRARPRTPNDLSESDSSPAASVGGLSNEKTVGKQQPAGVKGVRLPDYMPESPFLRS